jgi:hypothetical protein
MSIHPRSFLTRLHGPGVSGGSIIGGFQIPNLSRQPFYRHFWIQQFVNRQHGFSMHHVGLLTLVAFFGLYGMFESAPIERQDKYYMNGAKFRLQSAYSNPGKRPAFTIAREQAKIRYYYRGMDHPMTVNESKDLLWKLRENWIIQSHPAAQYPNVARQMKPTSLPDVIHTKATPYPEESSH